MLSGSGARSSFCRALCSALSLYTWGVHSAPVAIAFDADKTSTDIICLLNSFVIELICLISSISSTRYAHSDLMRHLFEPNQYQLDGSSAAAPKSAAIWCTLPKYPHVKIADMIKVRVALKHESNMRVPVWKTVEAIRREGLTVEVDRSCFFAYDSMSIQDGPRLLLQLFQEANLVCQCCNRNQHEWNLVHTSRLHQEATLTWCMHLDSIKNLQGHDPMQRSLPAYEDAS